MEHLPRISGFFLSNGRRYDKSKPIYDIGLQDNEQCKQLKEMFNKTGIDTGSLINQHCTRYLHSFDDFDNITSPYLDTRKYKDGSVYHNNTFFSMRKNTYDSKVRITNYNQDESNAIITRLHDRDT